MCVWESVTARCTVAAAVLWTVVLGYLHEMYDLSLRTLANTSLTAMAVLVTAFTVLYATRSNWRANHIGHLFLVKSTLLSLVLCQVSLSVWTGSSYPGRDQIRLAIYAGGALAFVGMLVSLWREQQRDRKGGGRDA